MSRTLKLTLEYDGRGFQGWQAQGAGRRTVQGVLVEAVRRLTGETVAVRGAGRTDAGVHALGQVASLVLERSALDLDAVRDGLNAHLPGDVAVVAAEEVPDGFDARKSAIGKTYRYLIHVRPARSPLLAGRAWHRTGPLDLEAMRDAAAALVGRHDFSAFRASAGQARQPVRAVTRLDIGADPSTAGLLRVEVEGDGFLMHMVRIVVGTLVEVGRGRMPAAGLAEILAGRDRRAAGPTAPPEGLYLVEVRYPAVAAAAKTGDDEVEGRGSGLDP